VNCQDLDGQVIDDDGRHVSVYLTDGCFVVPELGPSDMRRRVVKALIWRAAPTRWVAVLRARCEKAGVEDARASGSSTLALPKARCKPCGTTHRIVQAASPPTLAKDARMGHPQWKWCPRTSLRLWPPGHLS